MVAENPENQRRRESDPRISKIEIELAVLSAQLARHEQGGEARGRKIDAVDQKVEDLLLLAKRLDRIEETLYGNGKPGIVMLIDRIEQVVESFKRLTWALVAALITTGVVLIIQAVIHAAASKP